MRIKIKGEITAERLAEALHAAAEKYEAVRPGHKVYGANLYLTAFDADGLPFDLVDHRGEPLSITIEAKSGELVKPALTAEGEAHRQKAKEEARRQAEEAEAEAQRRHRQTLDEYEQERQKRPFFASRANLVSVPPRIHSCRASFISPTGTSARTSGPSGTAARPHAARRPPHRRALGVVPRGCMKERSPLRSAGRSFGVPL